MTHEVQDANKPEEELALLMKAAALYEEYGRINSFAIEPQVAAPQLPYADWAHPIGFVMNDAR